MTDPDIAAIVCDLTDVQKRALIGACMTHPNIGGEAFVTVDFAGPWPVSGIAEFLSLRTDLLTAFGLRVRDHIIRSERDA